MDSQLFALCAAFSLGILLAMLGVFFLFQRLRRLLADLLQTSETRQREVLGDLSQAVKTSVHESSMTALSQTTESVIQAAGQKLSADRELISQQLQHNKLMLSEQLGNIVSNFNKMSETMKSSEQEKEIQLAQLATLVRSSQSQTQSLAESTANLTVLLSGSQTRGQLGERLADDILKLAGFIEGVNYQKQKTLANGNRPDFSFILPKGKLLHMDVKFPVQNYIRALEEIDKEKKEKLHKLFLGDIKAAYKGLQERNYAEAKESVDCVLVFIPHEQVFSFVHEKDPAIFDRGLEKGIVTCSPMTLFAVLAVIRTAVEQFTIESTAGEILQQITAFRKQWDMFQKSFQTMGKRISDLGQDYEKLATTRCRLMERQFEKFDKIQSKVDEQ